jgi:hypothetical protein
MRSDIKERWLVALRSGEYKQGRRALTRIKSSNNEKLYCCLGVLCDILSDESSIFKNNGTRCNLNNDALIIYESVTDTLTIDQRAYVGLNRNECNKLIHMNDTYEQSFNEIADYIKEHL